MESVGCQPAAPLHYHSVIGEGGEVFRIGGLFVPDAELIGGEIIVVIVFA